MAPAVGDRVPAAAVEAAADTRLRARRLAGRAARVDRREVLGLDRLRRRPPQPLHARTAPRQRDRVLVHRHRRVLGPSLLGERGSGRHRRRRGRGDARRPGHRPDRRLDLPARDPSPVATMGRDAIREPPLVERARSGRPLRRVRAARPLRRGGAGVVPPGSLRTLRRLGISRYRPGVSDTPEYKCRTEAVIPASVEDVWAALADLSEWAQWWVVVRVEPIDPAEATALRPGFRFHITGSRPGGPPRGWIVEVLDVVPNERIDLLYAEGDLYGRTSWEL